MSTPAQQAFLGGNIKFSCLNIIKGGAGGFRVSVLLSINQNMNRDQFSVHLNHPFKTIWRKIGFTCPTPKVWTLYSKVENMVIISNVTLTFCFTEQSLKMTWEKSDYSKITKTVRRCLRRILVTSTPSSVVPLVMPFPKTTIGPL